MTGSKPPLRRWSRLLPGRALPGCQRCVGHGGPGQGPGAKRPTGGEGKAPRLRNRTGSARTARRPAPTADALPRSLYLSPPVQSNCRRAAGGAGATQSLLSRPVSAKLGPPRPGSAGASRHRSPRARISPVIPGYPGISSPWGALWLGSGLRAHFVHPLFTKAVYAQLPAQAPLAARPFSGATQTAYGARPLQRRYANLYACRVRLPSLAAALRKPRTPPVRGAGVGAGGEMAAGAAGREKGRPEAGTGRWTSRGAQCQCPQPPFR